MFAIIFSVANLSSQKFAAAANNVTMQQHAKHITDNLIVSQHIPLTGSLLSGDYILLMDFTPFATSVEGHTDIALVNTSNETLNFNRGGYSVTITVHGSAIQHLALNETGK